MNEIRIFHLDRDTRTSTSQKEKRNVKNVRTDFYNEKYQYCITESYIIICRDAVCWIVELYVYVISVEKYRKNETQQQRKIFE